MLHHELQRGRIAKIVLGQLEHDLDPAGVAELARSVSGVGDVHRVRSRGMKRAVELDLHLEVAPEMSVVDAHKLAQKIEREVKVKFPEVSDVIIHVEPTPKPNPEPRPPARPPTASR